MWMQAKVFLEGLTWKPSSVYLWAKELEVLVIAFYLMSVPLELLITRVNLFVTSVIKRKSNCVFAMPTLCEKPYVHHFIMSHEIGTQKLGTEA